MMADLKVSYYLALDKLTMACKASRFLTAKLDPTSAKYFKKYQDDVKIKQMKKDADMCWPSLSKLRVNSHCCACAADNFKSFYQNRTLISAPVCKNLLSSCGSHFADVFDLVKLLGPYGTLLKILDAKETKSRIDQEEQKFNAKKEDRFINL